MYVQIRKHQCDFTQEIALKTPRLSEIPNLVHVVLLLDVESTHGGGAMRRQVIKFTVETWDTTLAPTVSTEL